MPTPNPEITYERPETPDITSNARSTVPGANRFAPPPPPPPPPKTDAEAKPQQHQSPSLTPNSHAAVEELESYVSSAAANTPTRSNGNEEQAQPEPSPVKQVKKQKPSSASATHKGRSSRRDIGTSEKLTDDERADYKKYVASPLNSEVPGMKRAARSKSSGTGVFIAKTARRSTSSAKKYSR